MFTACAYNRAVKGQATREASSRGHERVVTRDETDMRVDLIAAALPLVPAAAARKYFIKPPSRRQFKARHAQVLAKIGENAVAVVQGVHQTEGFTLPRQHNTFYYLSGIETPGAYLLLADGRTKRVTISLLSTSGSRPPKGAFWSGRRRRARQTAVGRR